MNENYDYCRLYIDGLGTADEVEQRLLSTGHYQLDGRSLVADKVAIDVRRNKNGFVIGRDGPPNGANDWLGWPVTMEIFRDEDDVPDTAMVRVVSLVGADVRGFGGRAHGDEEFVKQD